MRSPSVRTLAVLHPVFALTGVLHAVGGALLPSIAIRFHLSDTASGLLFLLYFAGTSIGALLCRGAYARLLALGFAAMACCCIVVAIAPRAMLAPAFLLLGISVGVPMSAVTLFVGRAYPARCAALLTILNFSWSIGALCAPLIAAHVLAHHAYPAAYVLFAAAAGIAALACALILRDSPESEKQLPSERQSTPLYLIGLFAFAAFLQVGIENTVAAWLPTYALRMASSGVVLAAASTSFYWAGFLCSRGLCSLVLLRADSMRVFRTAVAVAFVSALLLVFAPSGSSRNLAMFLLGASLAPTYPLVLSGFFARSSKSADTRWILFTAGFGGSVLPWIAGFASTSSGSLRVGMLSIPAALLLMATLLPALRDPRSKSAQP